MNQGQGKARGHDAPASAAPSAASEGKSGRACCARCGLASCIAACGMTAIACLEAAEELFEAAPNTNVGKCEALLTSARVFGLPERHADRASVLERKLVARRDFLKKWSRQGARR